MGTILQRFWRDESGPEMVEWAVVTVILLASTTVVMILLRDRLIELFLSIFEALSEPADPNWIG